MLRFLILCTAYFLCTNMVLAQNQKKPFIDTLHITQLQEVIINTDGTLSDKSAKPLASLDEYLEKASTLNMIRRGAYAWEPFLNGLSSERSVITIDGMRIYAACTDKMDPVTSYTEITNLAQAKIYSGQSGTVGGATIAGSLNLIRKKSTFAQNTLKGMVFTGLETNNLQKIAGTTISLSKPRFFADADFTYRHARNYKAGGGQNILYSQFTKYNMSAVAGYKINQNKHIEASVIYDQAMDVGYPALPMDVSLAKALMVSAEYIQHPVSPSIQQWQTKLYYNSIVHVMDDAKRPVVPIRMDMPGWSKTVGFYSVLQGSDLKNSWKTSLSGHHNQSLAQMTMQPNTPHQKDMFMLTWPNVHINYIDIYAEDNFTLSKTWKAAINGGVGVHNNQVNSQFGFESLQIFYPEMSKSNTRLLKRASVIFQYEKNHWLYNAGFAYGERAPSVSEGYGFYLFNSFDRFDYLGNPNLKNEKSTSLNTSLAYQKTRFSAKLSGAYFLMKDYIIGRPQSGLSTMTVGANGIKIYGQLNQAYIFNGTFNADYQFTKNWLFSTQFSYRRGYAQRRENLPLMQPFSYQSSLAYSFKSFTANVALNGAAKQQNINASFGEQALPAYALLNLSAANRFKINSQSFLLKVGIENMFDKNYTTFADWNRLARMGRNIFINVIFNF